MNSTAKTLIPDREWLIKDGSEKIGSIAKVKKGYVLLKQGRALPFKSLSDVTSAFGVSVFEESIKKVKKEIAGP